jgi:hypothetical protein
VADGLRKLLCGAVEGRYPTDIGGANFETDGKWLEILSVRHWWLGRSLVKSGPF